MFKKISLALFAVATLATASDTVSVKVQEAVVVNHNLIKDLYKKIEHLEGKIEHLSASRTVSGEKAISKTGSHYVSVNGLNVRTSPTVKKGNIFAKLHYGESVTCESIRNEWCRTNDGLYVWAKGLSKPKGAK